MNVTSHLVLALTFPEWGWFKDDLKKKWLIRQPERYVYVELNSDQEAYEGFNWVITGPTWAAIMFILSTFIFYLVGTFKLSINNIAVSALGCIAGGILFDYAMKLFMGKKGQEAVPHSN